MKRLFSWLTLLSLLFITGCAANGPKFNNEMAATDKDNLYIYRPSNFLSGGLSASVYVDDKHIGTLKNGGYLKLNVGSGTHTIRVGKQSRTFSSTDNGNSFFRYTYGWALFFVIPIAPEILDAAKEELAIGELKETNLSL